MRFPLCNHHLLTAPQLLQTGLLYEDQRVEGMERVTVCFLKILKVCLRLASPLSETWVVFALRVIKVLWRLTGLCGGHTYHTLRDYGQHMQPICDVHTWFIGTRATELHAPPKHPGTLSWRTHKSHCAWRDPWKTHAHGYERKSTLAPCSILAPLPPAGVGQHSLHVSTERL